MTKKADTPLAKAQSPAPDIGLEAPSAVSTFNSETRHSRAFDRLIDGPDDIVGLLAYALFKQSVREAAINGNSIDTKSRDLPEATVIAFRSSAEKIIEQVVGDAITTATPEIQNAATVSRIDAVHSDLIAVIGRERTMIETHVTNRTGFIAAFATNVLAWVVSLIIAFLILYLANQPSIDQVLQKTVQNQYVSEQKGAK